MPTPTPATPRKEAAKSAQPAEAHVKTKPAATSARDAETASIFDSCIPGGTIKRPVQR